LEGIGREEWGGGEDPVGVCRDLLDSGGLTWGGGSCSVTNVVMSIVSIVRRVRRLRVGGVLLYVCRDLLNCVCCVYPPL
jgi:hypothetical protein